MIMVWLFMYKADPHVNFSKLVENAVTRLAVLDHVLNACPFYYRIIMNDIFKLVVYVCSGTHREALKQACHPPASPTPHLTLARRTNAHLYRTQTDLY